LTSLQQRLLVGLLTAFALMWLWLSAAIYRSTQHEVEELFDAEMAQAAATIGELALDEDPDRWRGSEPVLERLIYGHKYELHISFQIWRDEGLILRSRSAPNTPMADEPGFSDRMIEDRKWRVFGLWMPEHGLRLVVAQDYRARIEITDSIVRHTLLPLLWMTPILGILVWWSIHQGLRPLSRLAAEVASRSPRLLEPVSAAGAPTEAAPLVDALNDLLGRLREAFDNEVRFTADAAHELRTPLTAIRAHAQIALRAQDETGRESALRSVITGVDRSSHLLDQLLMLARLDVGDQSQMAPVDLAGLVLEVCEQQSAAARSKHVALAVHDDCGDKLGCRVLGSRTGLAVLIRNLVENAIRYTPNGGRVEIRLSHSATLCSVTIADSGPGIEKHERERVFERFYRRPGSDGYGSGLGLSIVQRIAMLHRASLRLGPGLGDRPGLSVEVGFRRSAG